MKFQTRWMFAVLGVVVLAAFLLANGGVAADPKQVLRASPTADSTPSANGPGDEKRYIRVTYDDRGNPLAMETSVVRMVPDGSDRPGLSVDLVSAVHVGDKS